MNASLHKPDVRESTTITLRFDPRMLARIKRNIADRASEGGASGPRRAERT